MNLSTNKSKDELLAQKHKAEAWLKVNTDHPRFAESLKAYEGICDQLNNLYHDIYVTDGYKHLTPDDMLWLDENVTEEALIEEKIELTQCEECYAPPGKPHATNCKNR